ncbi:hypothetical protein AB1Y20_023119 [Prymnesium parvum]|uniref:Phospholipid scramblase n=1 Tax=Prymnesium parvum TaxID=97485 RepID=A0AB34JD31_PRYPA|mmetsp:Transcript_29439/g.44421  ORF Transcript_29439/g.44421 Transcript_29439/m.44421 type:complete len:166 (-) Transcript_29439:476-973(-)
MGRSAKIDPGIGNLTKKVMSPCDFLKNKICSGFCCSMTIFNPTYPDCCGCRFKGTCCCCESQMVQCIPACLEGVEAPGHSDAVCLCSDGFQKCVIPDPNGPWIKSISQCCCFESRCAFPCDAEVPCNLNMYCINCVTDFKIDFEILKTAPASSFGGPAAAEEMER